MRSLPALLLLLSGCSSPSAPASDLGPGEAPPDRGGAEARADQLLGDGSAANRCAPGPALTGRVDPARMLADLKFLTGLKERTSAAGQKQAVDYLRSQLASLPGLELHDQSYTYQGQSYVNLEVTVRGDDQADSAVLAGAHYDSISKDSLAPGADDDGSGTVAVLETARVLAGCRPRRSVRLIFFSNEEKGTIGSGKYVAALKATLPPSQVVGFLNVDMVGFGPPTEDLDLATKPADQPLAEATKAAVEKWTPLKAKLIVGDQCG